MTLDQNISIAKSIFFCVSFIFDMSTLRADVGYVPDEFDLK